MNNEIPDAETGGCGMGAKVPGVDSPGDWIGPYKLLRIIGEGGFGVVWEAEQRKPIARRVAIKVLKAGMDTAEVLARFSAERQALARMEHPNIAGILDAGATANGRPYFAMEFVSGVPITRFCDEHGYSPRRRLALFQDVCSAVNHAHQKGIIHRDLKPTNVLVCLVGEQAVAKVIDFGIAKATEGNLSVDGTLYSMRGTAVGSPIYMSPEQADAGATNIDTRSDIYSLGALLYNLLAGVPPFDKKLLQKAGIDEMLRIIREVEPIIPSLRRRECGVDAAFSGEKAGGSVDWHSCNRLEPELDWIVMKALDKCRDKRYATADALAEDIRRFLAGDAVDARPTGRLYLLGKRVRKHKVAVLVVAAVLAVVSTGAVLSVWQAKRAMWAEREGQDRLAEAIAERNAKELALRDAGATGKFIVDLFQNPDQALRSRDLKVAEFLDAATVKMEREFRDHPLRLAALQETLARTYSDLGKYGKSLDLWKSALENRRNCQGVEHPEFLESLSQVITACETFGAHEEARDFGEEEVGLRRRLQGDGTPETRTAMERLERNYARSGNRDKALVLQKEISGRFGSSQDSPSGGNQGVPSGPASGNGIGKPAGQAQSASLKPNTPVPDGNQSAAFLDWENAPELKDMEQELFRLGRENSQNHEARREVLLRLVAACEQQRIKAEEQRDLAKNSGQSGTRANWFPSLERKNAKAIGFQKELLDASRSAWGDDDPKTLGDEDALIQLLRAAEPGDNPEAHLRELVDFSKTRRGPGAPRTLLLQSEMLGQFWKSFKCSEAKSLADEMLPFWNLAESVEGVPLAVIRRLAIVQSLLGDPRQSMNIFSKYCILAPEDTEAAFVYGGLLVWDGQHALYREHRKRMLEYANHCFESEPVARNIVVRGLIYASCFTALDDPGQAKTMLYLNGLCRDSELPEPASMVKSNQRNSARNRIDGNAPFPIDTHPRLTDAMESKGPTYFATQFLDGLILYRSGDIAGACSQFEAVDQGIKQASCCASVMIKRRDKAMVGPICMADLYIENALLLSLAQAGTGRLKEARMTHLDAAEFMYFWSSTQNPFGQIAKTSCMVNSPFSTLSWLFSWISCRESCAACGFESWAQ